MYLKLHLPLEKGLPLVLEQLTGLKTLEITDTGEGRMHLDRPLDPFLDMVLLRLLTFSGKAAKSLELTPDASMFLALAKKRTEEGTLKPRASGKELVLNY
ncbi:g7314 [Coccomyxa viridis]|uniref:G7314 protein n=1 Tax=Coccomyxa viridis TaxID=1274662 RepID=A0ABP1FXJ6_9CHLO